MNRRKFISKFKTKVVPESLKERQTIAKPAFSSSRCIGHLRFPGDGFIVRNMTGSENPK